MTTIKAYLEGPNPETRRFVVDLPQWNSFRALVEQIRHVFPSLATADFTLSWKDNDGDMIVMSSDPELTEALANAQNSVLKLHITTSPDKQEPHTSGGPGQIHHGVTCDMCCSGVRGIRYKCLQCEDYDLCETCHAKKTHEQHDMLKLVTPGNRPVWALPGSRRLWKHCVRNQAGGKGHHHGWSHRRCPSSSPEGTSAENAGASPQAGERPEAPAGDAFTAARAQYHELLNGIGGTIANLLDPLGINVAYHVDVATRTQTGTEAKTQTEATGPLSSEKEGAAAGGASTQTYTEGAHSSEKKDTATEPMDTTTSTSVPAASMTESKAKASAPLVVPAAPLYPTMEEPSDTYGWTVLNQEERSDRASASPARVEDATDSRTTVVDEAFSQMISMGFTNEGGWLRKLLEVKQGDISAVLESLNPTRH